MTAVNTIIKDTWRLLRLHATGLRDRSIAQALRCWKIDQSRTQNVLIILYTQTHWEADVQTKTYSIEFVGNNNRKMRGPDSQHDLRPLL